MLMFMLKVPFMVIPCMLSSSPHEHCELCPVFCLSIVICPSPLDVWTSTLDRQSGWRLGQLQCGRESFSHCMSRLSSSFRERADLSQEAFCNDDHSCSTFHSSLSVPVTLHMSPFMPPLFPLSARAYQQSNMCRYGLFDETEEH